MIMTEWDTYKSPDYLELADRLVDRVIFDGRNILDPVQAREAGLLYIGIGRSGEWDGGAASESCSA
jgi:UDPglucose 6-dehydrogenase